MINILVVTHGKMAEGIVHSAKMFTKEAKNVEFLCLMEDMGQDELSDLMNGKMKGVSNDEQFLIFCDIMGGTPFKISSEFSFNNHNVAVFYGVNLPILVHAILSKDGQSLSSLTSELVAVSNDSLGLGAI
ncbi:PTS sugar transporter subunit IIA [Lysinibacillus xylanilyticus]|uniref:PTS sugar transporter subunit IIA n=1 Tax=Lysinibacillus xylanilyticus TaxID=582475 RepID=UPI003D064392